MKTPANRKPLILNKNILLLLIWILIFLSFPSGVLCGMRDVIDEISFVVLIFICFIFLCALIGFFSRRINGEGPTKSGSIFK